MEMLASAQECDARTHSHRPWADVRLPSAVPHGTRGASAEPASGRPMVVLAANRMPGPGRSPNSRPSRFADLLRSATAKTTRQLSEPVELQVTRWDPLTT